MAKLSDPSGQLIGAVCKLVGIDPSNVRRIKLDAHYGFVPEVELTQQIDFDAARSAIDKVPDITIDEFFVIRKNKDESA